jgi:hypothetical protein
MPAAPAAAAPPVELALARLLALAESLALIEPFERTRRDEWALDLCDAEAEQAVEPPWQMPTPIEAAPAAPAVTPSSCVVVSLCGSPAWAAEKETASATPARRERSFVLMVFPYTGSSGRPRRQPTQATVAHPAQD